MESVLILTSDFRPNLGGIETHLDDIIKFLNKNHYFVYLITFAQASYSKVINREKLPSQKMEITSGYEIRRFHFVDFWLNNLIKNSIVRDFTTFINIFLYTFFFMLFNNHKIKLIHAQGPATALAAFFLSKLFGKKWFLTLHCVYPFSGMKGVIGRYVFKDCATIFTVSSLVKDKLEKDMLGKPVNIATVNYWIDTNLFNIKDRIESRKALQLPSNGFYIFFISRLLPEKGVVEFIEVAKRDKEKKFVIVGDGELSEYVKNNQTDNLIYLGRKSGQDLINCYNAADIMCAFCTRPEGFGRRVIESLSCGTPVVVTNTFPKESINDYVGRFIPNMSHNKILPATSDFANRKDIKELRNACRNFVLENYSESNGFKIIDMYKKLALPG